MASDAADYGAVPQGEAAAPTPKPSFVTVGFLVMLGDSVRGIFFPTLWPLVSSFGGSRSAQGVIVAAFSMGRMVVSPYYGAYSSKHGYRGVLIFAHCVIIVGALLYTQVRGLVSLFCVQVLLGCGCGTLGCTRAYFAESVPRELRTVYLARVTALQYAGLTATSFLGSGLSNVGGWAAEAAGPEWAWLRLSPLTFSAYGLVLGATVAILLLRAPSFHDFVPAAKAPAARDAEAPELRRQDSDKAHFRLVLVGLVLNIITKGSIGCYETLGVNFAEMNLGISGPATGVYVSAFGLVGVAFLLAFKSLGRLFDDVELVVYGIGVMVASCLLMLRRRQNVLADARSPVGYAVWLTAMFFMYGVGYPVGHTAVIGWFSKAMKARPQGMLLGLFASAGSLARIVFPIAAGVCATYLGSNWVFALLGGLLGGTCLVIVVFQKAFRDAIA